MVQKLLILTLFTLFTFIDSFCQTPPDRTWYRDDYNRKLNVKEKWQENNSGLKHGIYIKYFSNAEREILGYYTNGEKSGEWVITNIYITGIKSKIVCHFKNDKLNGSWIETSWDGKEVIEKGEYENGLKVGEWLEFPTGLFDQSGHVKGSYVNGKREGWWTDYRGYHHHKWTESKDFKQYTLSNDNDYGKGYKTLFKNGEIVKVINEKGENEAEECDYKNCLWATGDKTSFSDEKIIKILNDFMSDFPNSKYATEVKAMLTNKRAEMEQKESDAQKKEEALILAKQGDKNGIDTYFGEPSELGYLHYLVNHSVKDSKNYFSKAWNYSSSNVNHKVYGAKHEIEAEVFMAVLKKSSIHLISEAMNYWDEKGTSKIDKFYFSWSEEQGISLKWSAKGYYHSDYHIRLYILNDEIVIKEYGKTGLKLFHNTKLVHTTTTDNMFEGFTSLSENAKHLVTYSYILKYKNRLQLKEFGYLAGYIDELTIEHQKQCYSLLLEQIESDEIKIDETSKHNVNALKTVILSVLNWQTGNKTKSIELLKNSDSNYQKYNSLYDSWQPCSIGDYVKFFVSQYLNKDNSVELNDEKEYLKIVKKL